MTTKPNAKRLARMEALVNHDRAYAAFGTALAGMDEAGRGRCWAAWRRGAW